MSMIETVSSCCPRRKPSYFAGIHADISGNRWWAVSLSVLCSLVFLPAVAAAYTPESPQVKEAIRKAAAYLETAKGRNYGTGGGCLVSLALYKAGRDEADPAVQAGVADARKLADSVAKSGIGGTCYNESIACILLSDLGDSDYSREIGIIANGLMKRQRPNGAWGYEPHTYDDTSQSQYGVLCLWAAHHHGLPVNVASVERAAQWFMRVQDPSGGWSYMARDAGSFQRVKQGEVTPAMAAAGIGSLYVCAHLLGFTAEARKAEKEDDDGLPPAVQRVENEKEKKKGPSFLRPQTTNGGMLAAAQQLGNRWFGDKISYDVDVWTHYYMYAVERYKSFQEQVEGQTVAEPAWYNDGVDYLLETQAENGSWKTKESHGSGPEIDTAFAVLFLTRSSQKSIRKAVLNEGMLVGGFGLPKNLSNARIQDGQVVTPAMVKEVDDLLDMIESADDMDFDINSLAGNLSLDEDLTKRSSQLERLRDMVSNGEWQARLLAVKTLAQAHELDNVPVLIFALTDPDYRVAKAARDGLRLISRKFFGFGMPDRPTEEDQKSAQQKWRAWYLSIRPDAELLE